MTQPLHTIADWQAAYAAGAEPNTLLTALLARLDAADTAWIHRCTPEQLAAFEAAQKRHG